MVQNDRQKHTVRYTDLGKAEFDDLTGEIEVILTRRQAKLLVRLNYEVLGFRTGISHFYFFWYLHIRMIVTYPRLIHLTQYYDPENLDLAGFDGIDNKHVRLTFVV